MRYVLVAVLFTVLVPPLCAQEDDKEKEKSRYMIGLGYRSGNFAPALAMSDTDRQVNAATAIMFGEVRSKRGYAYGETTYLGAAQSRLQTHAFGAHGALVSVFGLNLDAGLDYRYLSEPAPVFELARNRIESVRRQHSLLLSLGGRWGSYEGFYIRYSGFGGAAYVENSLELFVDNTYRRRNISDVDSGVVQLYGFRGETGLTFKRFHLRGGAMTFYTRDAPPGTFEMDPIFFGTISYATPWHVGFYVQGTTTANTNAQHLTFLNDTVTFGITASYP